MLAILLLSCAFGCNQERHQFNAPGTLAAPLAVPDRISPVEAILAGGTAKRIRDAGYDPMLLDNSRKMSSEFYMVDIGVDLPERFDKWATVRASRSGIVERLETCVGPNGEDHWVPDAKAEREVVSPNGP